MPVLDETLGRLAGIPALDVLRDVPLATYTRFGIGGPADIFVIAQETAAFLEALGITRSSGLHSVVIGDGSNLIVADEGFRGVVLKLATTGLARLTTSERPSDVIEVESGVPLQTLVDFSISEGLRGVHTMTGIPGFVGGAVYGNAGAYGHSISESIEQVTFYDGQRPREFTNEECQFRYRESIFKEHKEWIILATRLRLSSSPSAELRNRADGIRRIRDEKYPPTMRCAGSIFKNLLIANLPSRVVDQIPASLVREGKVPSAWFLEQAGAKGMRVGDIQVASYHANLIYNDGPAANARDLLTVIDALKRRVRERFGIEIEEEVQYVGNLQPVAVS